MEGERPPGEGGGGPGGGGPPGKLPSGDGGGVAGGGGAAPPQHEVFGDTNLLVALGILALVALMQQMMAPPCTC